MLSASWLLLVAAAFGAAFYILYPFVLPARASAVAAIVVAVVVGVALALPWPGRPLAEALEEKGLSSLRSYGWVLAEARTRREKEAFQRALIERFSAPVKFTADGEQPARLSGTDWRVGRAEGRRA